MATTPDTSRLELLRGTLDMLILRTLMWGLEKHGWLMSEGGVSEANQRAKYYQLTTAGKAQLAREQDRWSQLVHAIGRIMNPAPVGKE